MQTRFTMVAAVLTCALKLSFVKVTSSLATIVTKAPNVCPNCVIQKSTLASARRPKVDKLDGSLKKVKSMIMGTKLTTNCACKSKT